MSSLSCLRIFFFNDTATTEIYTLSLHDALPICCWRLIGQASEGRRSARIAPRFLFRTQLGQSDVFPTISCLRFLGVPERDRKSTRLNSSHANISYAVFCLKKKTHIYTHSPVTIT